jgi:PncC family amidohydrolase
MRRVKDFIAEINILARSAVYMGAHMDAGRLFTFAESCTGGLLAAAVTSVPGVSASFPGSVVTYSNEDKVEKLSVRPETLARYGAVSGQCAAQMARGARALFGVRIAVSITGIAGPDGGSQLKPVGTVWFGLSVDGATTVLKGLYQGRPRRIVQLCATRAGLRLLIRGLCLVKGVSSDDSFTC